jgi:predicted ATP-binding protein involved in virulence
MYLQEISIKNYGPISDLKYEFKFNENQVPKPVVFVGKNGSGKTLLLTSLVHSLIELKRTSNQELQEVDEGKYYRLGFEVLHPIWQEFLPFQPKFY